MNILEPNFQLIFIAMREFATNYTSDLYLKPKEVLGMFEELAKFRTFFGGVIGEEQRNAVG